MNHVWDLNPFSFRFDWIYDPVFGWLEFYWFADDLDLQQEIEFC